MVYSQEDINQGTIAEGSSLIIERPELPLLCHEIVRPKANLQQEKNGDEQCGSASLELIGGREMEVVSLLEEEIMEIQVQTQIWEEMIELLKNLQKIGKDKALWY